MIQTDSLVYLEPSADLGALLVQRYHQDLLAQYEEEFEKSPAGNVEAVIADPSVMACLEFVLGTDGDRRRIAAEMLAGSVRSVQTAVQNGERGTWPERAEQALQPEVGRISARLLQAHAPDDANADSVMTPRIAELDRTRVADAYRRIADRWPAAALEMEAVISRVVGVTGTVAKNFTIRRVPLVIFLNCDQVGRDEADVLAQRLVHETGHQVLSLAERFVPLVVKSDRRLKTPLRADLRPLGGVLHQAFALHRMVGYWRHVPEDELTEVTRRERYHRTQYLVRTLELLRDAPELTSAGQVLVSQMDSQVDETVMLILEGGKDGRR